MVKSENLRAAEELCREELVTSLSVVQEWEVHRVELMEKARVMEQDMETWHCKWHEQLRMIKKYLHCHCFSEQIP